MIDAATLRAWAAEIETELTAARSELAYDLDRLRDAEDFAASARREQQSIQLQLAALRQPIAFQLAARVSALGDRAGAAAGEAVTLRNNAALLRERIDDLEQAQQQIAELLAALAPAVEEEPVNAA